MGIWGGHPFVRGKTPECSGKCGSLPVDPPHHRQRRKKRFRVRREALGFGYDHFDLPGPAAPLAQVPSEGVVRRPFLAPTRAAHESARNGLWICACLLVLTVACVEFTVVQKFFASLIYCLHVMTRFWQL